MEVRVKHVKKEKETFEGASNDAVVASLGRSVGGHAHVGASESEFPEQKYIRRETAQQNTTVKCDGLRLGDVA